jgi:hypothetical protein
MYGILKAVEVEVTLRQSVSQSVSQSVCLGIQHPCGNCDQILFPVRMLLYDLTTYNFSARTSRKRHSLLLLYSDHSENIVPLFFHRCKRDCSRHCLAKAFVYIITIQTGLAICCLLSGHCLAPGVHLITNKLR